MGLYSTGRIVARKIYRTGTSPLRLLPDFIIIGAQKGGTTSLYLYLTEHPNIGGARMKEINFFDKNFQYGIRWYQTQFPTGFHKYYTEFRCKQDYLVGEASPNYLFYPHTPGRIVQALPRAKLIMLLRNPVERAYSQYRHNVARSYEDLSFEEAIDRERIRIEGEEKKVTTDADYYSYAFMRHSYLARGRYAEQLERWFGFFPKEQFLLLKSEDLYTDPVGVYKQTLAFLEVPIVLPQSLQKEFKLYNKSEDTLSGMEPATRERLIAYFEPYNARLYELVGRDFGWA